MSLLPFAVLGPGVASLRTQIPRSAFRIANANIGIQQPRIGICPFSTSILKGRISPLRPSPIRRQLEQNHQQGKTIEKQKTIEKDTPSEQTISAHKTSEKDISADKPAAQKEVSEEILNAPNILTLSRIVSVPFLGYFIVNDQLPEALVLLFLAGCTDVVDGWLARKYNKYTIFGSIADPAADKLLMTVMVATLGWKNYLPFQLATLILLRDIGLVLLAFRIRYTSLPPPITLSRYFNPHLPSAQVQPTQISKYNTFLQLLSVGGATLNAALLHDISGSVGSTYAEYLYWPLIALWSVTATTTVVSGWGYFVGGAGYRNVKATTGIGNKIGERFRTLKEEALKRGKGKRS
ncbi:unnamed protein product [Sympodiomycopsis kandeliae]